jgi:nucleoside 2-deoxyribosyltransferase
MKQRPLIYVAGPLSTGDTLGHIREAVRTGALLRGMGAVPLIPHLSALAHLIRPEEYETWMADDFELIARCDALFRMAGGSHGAEREELWANELGLTVLQTLGETANWIEQWEPA